jgi:quercetin dioxygenase-like cupin family protein
LNLLLHAIPVSVFTNILDSSREIASIFLAGYNGIRTCSYLRNRSFFMNNDIPNSAIPADDVKRSLAHARPSDEASLKHISLAGDTYTILLSSTETAGRYCLIDMLIPPGGGPPPHRHDFEEMFSLVEGELEFTFRGEKLTVRAGETVNIPANAPHAFTNASSKSARLLCMCTPAGQEEFFLEVGDLVPSQSSPPVKLDEEAMAKRGQKAKELAPQYKTEML